MSEWTTRRGARYERAESKWTDEQYWKHLKAPYNVKIVFPFFFVSLSIAFFLCGLDECIMRILLQDKDEANLMLNVFNEFTSQAKSLKTELIDF